VARASTPAQEITRLVREYGSDDRLVEAINAQLGTRLTRQMVIRWRTGTVGISKQWAKRLAAFTGREPSDFHAATSRENRQNARLDELERRVRRIERQLQLNG
jgi:polyhydroxyalkanoate synthesis regulator phasin